MSLLLPQNNPNSSTFCGDSANSQRLQLFARGVKGARLLVEFIRKFASALRFEARAPIPTFTNSAWQGSSSGDVRRVGRQHKRAHTRTYKHSISHSRTHIHKLSGLMGLVVSVTAAVESPVLFQRPRVSVHFIVKAINYAHDININSNIEYNGIKCNIVIFNNSYKLYDNIYN